jgi:hypothetical protein
MPGGYGGMMLFPSNMDVAKGLKFSSYGPVKRKTTIEHAQALEATKSQERFLTSAEERVPELQGIKSGI